MDEIITPHGFINLGGQEFKEDGTEYALRLGAASMIPEVYMPEEFFKRPRVFYQRGIPDCGANAGAFAAAYVDEHPGQEYSPDYQWVDIKGFDGYPLTDGTDMKSIFKSLKNGSLPYGLMPEKTALPLSQFSSPSRVTPAMKAEAAKHVIGGYGFAPAPQDMATLKNLIYTHKVLLSLIRLGDEFWTDSRGNTSWAEKDILPLRQSKRIISGHFIDIGAYDEKYAYFANWWSDRWGRVGYGYFDLAYLPQVVQIGTLVDSLDKVVLPKFERDLALGMSGPDVAALQRYLNAHGYQVGLSGAGSPGRETNYFGSLTRAAVSRLQQANGIRPTAGYFGPITRKFVNATL